MEEEITTLLGSLQKVIHQFVQRGTTILKEEGILTIARISGDAMQHLARQRTRERCVQEIVAGRARGLAEVLPGEATVIITPVLRRGPRAPAAASRYRRRADL